jgi:hypothetical protein
MRFPAWLSRLLPLVALPAAAAQSVCFLEGSSLTNASLRVIAESDPTAPAQEILSGIAVLDLEITNRTAQQALDPSVPRRVERLGAAMIELPAGGRLLRYAAGAGTRYGFVHIDATGRPIVLLELPAPAPNVDPFADRFAVAPDGRHAMFTTAQGNAFLARLDGGSYPSTGARIRPLPFTGTIETDSVCVGATHVFYQTEDVRVWRCALADGAVPEDVTPPLASGAILEGPMAPSGDGRWVVFLAGPQRSYELWLLGEQGPARKLPPPPAKYEEPGYLPEVPDGPEMLLNHDASRLLYVDATDRDEIWLLDTSASTPPTQLSSDENLQPYIGVSIFPSFVATTVVLAIGDLGRFDWFAAATGNPAILNLTRTAPETVAPYGAGTLLPTAAYALPSGTLIEESDGASGRRARLVDPSGASAVVANGLRGPIALGSVPSPRLEALPLAGRDGPVYRRPHLLLPAQQGDALLDLGLEPLLRAPAGVELSADALGPYGSSTFFAGLASGPRVPIVRLADGTLLALPPEPQLFQLVLTERLGLIVNGAQLRYVAAGVSHVLSTAKVRIVLS